MTKEDVDLALVVGFCVSVAFQILKKWKWLDATDAVVKQVSAAVLAAVTVFAAAKWQFNLDVTVQAVLAAIMALATHKALLQDKATVAAKAKIIAEKALQNALLGGVIVLLCLGLVAGTVAPASAQIADLQPLTITPAPMIQAPAPASALDTNWFDRHDVRWCAMKSADTLESIGTGLSLQLKEFSPGHSLWGDFCFQVAEGRNSGFGGLSTEAEGLPVPLLEAVLKPIKKLTLGVFDRFGVGTDGRGVSFYGVTDF